MNKATIISTINCENSNIANIKIQHQQIMTTIRKTFMKLAPKLKITILGLVRSEKFLLVFSKTLVCLI